MEKVDTFPFNLPFDENPNSAATELNFRNYFPADSEFEKYKTNRVRKGDEIEAQWKSQISEIVAEYHDSDALPLNILPKKPNEDLKRMLDKKLEKLNRRTEIAIVHLIRERLDSQENENDEKKLDNNAQKNQTNQEQTSKKGEEFHAQLDATGELVDTIDEEDQGKYQDFAEKLKRATEDDKDSSEDEDDRP
mmetsp:Transcript_27583/g.31758  ORF Transcript_27583/g.31758 Transcript_27583/m.31758 type:complete len:192 (+) Transcript_27583:40-615(+)